MATRTITAMTTTTAAKVNMDQRELFTVALGLGKDWEVARQG